MNKKTFIFYALFWLVSIMISGIVLGLYYNNIKKSEVKIVKHDEVNHVDIMAEIVRNRIRGLISDILVQASHAHLDELINNGNTEALFNLSTEFKSFISYKKKYDQIRLISLDGREVIRINYNEGNPSVVPKEQLQSKFHRYYFKQILNLLPEEIYMSPFDLNIENSKVEIPYKPMIRFGIPVSSGQGGIEGFIVLNYLGNDILHQIENKFDSSISESMMVDSDGYWLKAGNPDLEWGFMFDDKNDIRFSTYYEEAWEIIKLEDSGQFFNEKGLFTFNTINPLKISKESGQTIIMNNITDETYQWKIVSFIPSEKVLDKFTGLSFRMIFVYVIVIIFFTTIFSLAAFYTNRKREMSEKNEKLITELKKALDEVKTLSGLMPICSKCKKIRDDKGYWRQIDTYIEKHSDAEFSHGICPSCMEEMYKDKPWYEKWKKKNMES